MGSGYRVLHVTPFFPPDKGGIANHVSNLCFKLTDLGHDISVTSPKRWGSDISSTSEDQRAHRLPSIYLPSWPYPTLRSLSIPVDLGRNLDSIIRSGKFDIIHAHGHHYPITWMAIASASKYHIPSVLTLHGMYALNPGVLGGKTRLEMWFNKYVFTRILTRATSVIGLTKQITDYAREFGGGYTTYHTIANGVDTATYNENLKRKQEYRANYKIPTDNIVILFRGRFEHVKGVLEFANAVKNVVKTQGSKLQIFLVGGGALEAEVKTILKGLDQAHVLSWQPIEEVHELYIASDIFVLPSKFEALPITIIEAMNAGLHIVYTPVGGVPDILEKYVSKTMIKNSAVEEIESALTHLIPVFPVNANIEDSLNYARNFDWKNIALDVEKLYSKIGRIG